MVCFVHFDFEMCFAPQRRALFRHLNFQKWSDTEVFCTFSLRNVLRATTACTFSSLIWLAGSAPAALASLLFDPPEPQIIGKTHVSRFSYLFAHLHLLSSDSFSSTLLSSNLSLLSASALLCFSSVHIVGSLTSKLPSNICWHPVQMRVTRGWAWLNQTRLDVSNHVVALTTFLCTSNISLLSGMDVQKCSILSIRHSGMVSHIQTIAYSALSACEVA